MFVAAWLFLLGALTYCRAMAPPVAMALDGGNRETQSEAESHGEVMGVPDKRILKYFLPSAQAWGANELPYTGQEGAKRGYSDRNFLRFGRSSDVDKRVKNFLRFGRGGHAADDYEEEDMAEFASASPDKRNHNFLRFGRPDRNFLRFGRAGGSGAETANLEGSPLEFAQGLKVQEPSEEEKAEIEGYLRNTRGNNFLRFGRNYNKNFLRFGRSVDSQTYCDDCDEDEATIEKSSTTSESQDAERKSLKTGESSPSAMSKPSSTETLRSKRAAYHNYAKLTSRGPASWARALHKTGEDDTDDDDDDDDDNKGHRFYPKYNKDIYGSLGRFKQRQTSGNSGNSSSTDASQRKSAQTVAKAITHNAIRFG